MREELIEDLTRDLQAVRSNRSPWRIPAKILLASAASGAMMLSLIGFRSDIEQLRMDQTYHLELILLAFFTLTAVIMTERAAIPGRMLDPPRRAFGALLMSFTALLVVVKNYPSTGVQMSFWEGWHCLALIIVSAILPTLIGLRLVKREAPTWPRSTLAFALLGSFGAAVGIQHLICPGNSPLHLIAWHLAALPVSLLIAWLWGRRVLAW
ncbi:MAG TPA: DUF1109 domain-containing protein [Oligoflexus sp.]|uniref:DUF1109 domain-containing protein n=1 Tax=Oligoflexus sp. TaxID=1971216 RepID=UPI002D53D7F1|nr:DUF1109 domain-containing protein [Oligoflexus sp.]HYX32872.1 DUF1109 domain-containing protein [Oligoflexus sp.]